MALVQLRAASTLSRRRLLSLSAGGTLAVVFAGRLHAAAASTPAAVATKGTFLDAGVVHDIAVTLDQSAYAAMVETYAATGDKR